MFRNDRTGTVVSLSADGVRYHESGQLAGEELADERAWEARFERTGETIAGTPIAPTGAARRRRVELSREEWTAVFGPGVRHLRVHVPGDGPMTFEACGEAFRRAMAFFPRYFPDKPFEAFLCTSWLLDAQLQELLSPDSNMVRFQRELYLFPIFGYDPEDRRLAERVLGEVPDDPRAVSPETSLEAAVLERLEAGEPLHSRAGGGFLLPADLDWGEQVYLDQPLPWADDGP